LDARGAFQLFRNIARENRKKFETGDPDWQGLVFEQDLAGYVG